MHCSPPNQNFGRPCSAGLSCSAASAPIGSVGDAVSFPSGVRGEPRPQSQSHFAYCSQNASGCSIFGSLVSIAMSGKMNCQFRLRSNLVSAGNLRHINIIVVQTGKLIFVRSEIAAPLNFAALFGRTPRTCLRPALMLCISVTTEFFVPELTNHHLPFEI